MAKINSSNDIDIALQAFVSLGNIDTNQLNLLKEVIISIVSHPKLKLYFSRDCIIYNERDIITKNGIILRQDRLVINNKNEVVILDYKTGKPEKKHSQQLQTYQDALEEMSFLVINKILIYINESITIKEV